MFQWRRQGLGGPITSALGPVCWRPLLLAAVASLQTPTADVVDQTEWPAQAQATDLVLVPGGGTAARRPLEPSPPWRARGNDPRDRRTGRLSLATSAAGLGVVTH